MNFHLTNFGRVREANIELNGVTVIAGPNGSGKSTISRVLFTWQTYIAQLEHEMIVERAMGVVEGVNEALTANGFPEMIVSSLDRRNFSAKLLEESFWRNESAVIPWVAERLGRRLYYRAEPSTGLMARIASVYALIRDAALSRLAVEDRQLSTFILDRHLRRAFDNQVGTLFDVSAESEAIVTDDSEMRCGFIVRENVVQNLLGVGGTRRLQTFYLEPRHFLDDYARFSRYSSGMNGMTWRYSVDEANSWGRILNTNPQAFNMSFARAIRQQEINQALDRIVAIIRGELDKDEEGLVFKENDLPHNKGVSLKNIASGVKTIAALVRGLRNGTISPGCLIIIDEPETNLHPEWQVAFAKFLVLLNAQFGIRVLLNTHSPYFLKAIQVNADLYERGAYCSYYNMISRDGGSRYEADPVTDRIEEVFRAMSDPYARLVRGDVYGRRITG